jgi:hypothetical protein
MEHRKIKSFIQLRKKADTMHDDVIEKVAKAVKAMKKDGDLVDPDGFIEQEIRKMKGKKQ